MRVSRLALRCLVGFGVLAVAVSDLRGQDSNKFEAASIKRTSATERGGGSAGLQPGGRFVMVNGPTRVLLNMAYPTETREIAGAPDWVTFENYDVEARAGREISYDQLPAMLRDLLADRFNLVAHMETRIRPIYELRLARPDRRLGPDLRPTTIDCAATPASCTTRNGSGLIDSKAMSMAAFVTWLPALVGRPVIDKTALDGYFELLLRYSSDASTNLPAVPTALREQLGLTIEPVDAPMPVLVIDHVERPTSN